MARRRETENFGEENTAAMVQAAEAHLSNGDPGEDAGTRDDSGLTASERRRLTPEQRRERFLQVFGYYPEQEEKPQRFVRIGAGRVSRIIDGLRTLPALGNRSSYDFTAEQAEKMFQRLETELAEAKRTFERNALEGISRSKSFAFD